MENKAAAAEEQQLQEEEDEVIYFDPNATKMAQVVQSDPSGGWQKCWEQGLTPWDLGKPTPVLVHLHQTGALPKGRTLIPGCGSGYDVVAIACPERYVVGLDKSDKAHKRAKELTSSSPNADCLTFLNEDFFAWKPTELFDLIFDYTYEELLRPLGFKPVSIVENGLATGDREGREMLGRWKKVRQPINIAVKCEEEK
ncbi:hypothetical protein RHMOL_Rhmol09G0004100 [Rhododendron molle]|uniref:Uncharacterized protein n=1 Tax=Rhododendron molle TaxID=49168 RepID=A0ACC0M998_RHOML|nr:hypothetical protein RHMOL_Rhmol09G0004100 [Rhododendron molle]